MFKIILKIIAGLFWGAMGALIFTVFLLPYFLTSIYFENYQFVKDLKSGRIMVNQTDKVYIQENTAIENAIEKVKASLVVIQTPNLSLMSGLVATSDGNIVTLASGANTQNKLFLQGVAVDYTVVKVDKKNNLALLKVDKNNLQTVSFMDSDKIKLGQKVFLAAVTSTAMDNWLADDGMIKEINQTGLKTTIKEKSLATGSPLFNAAGELVGLDFIDSDGNISAIPIGKIRELLGL